ncbi:MAG: carboxypeptidase-like regulatory domain-containing protein, partial [Spirosomataceae bacterium]
MKKKLLRVFSILGVLLFLHLKITAQNNDVSGVVKTTNDEPLPGVSVQIKGTNVGTLSDAQGVYKISPQSGGATIIVSYIGFVSQEILIGNRTVINIELEEDSKVLSEVVVTALGIKREEKSLGFSATTINSNAVLDAKSNNW